MKMKRLKIIIPLVVALGAFGCSDDDTGATDTGTGGAADTGTAGTPDSGVGGPADTGAGQPDAGQAANDRPATGATQIDRAGRSAISTALIATFSTDDAAKGMRKDMYNQAGPADWANYTAEIVGALGIYDGLDTVCGNQFAAATDTASIAAGAYDALGGVLTDDRLYVNSATGDCNVYLAVEANATGIIPNADCGGRSPLYDTIDVTYSAVAIGAISGVSDGIDADNVAHPTTFPYMADPQ